MTTNNSKGAGNSGEKRSQVRPSAAAAESKRGDTASKGDSAPTELPPQFGRYRVLKKLGGGGMGTVYLVENTELERQEALKVPHFADGDDPKVRERFLREAKSAARLDHPNLCPVWDAGVQDGVYYMTMRFLKGKLLSDLIGEPLPARKAVEIVTKLAQALESAHGKGVIHRDLKPGNVMLVAGVGPVVMDFGLAKQVRQADKKLTTAGAMLGTPAYMPPEQVNGELEQMGPPSDVYSLGVILFELLTGQLPFQGSTAAVLGQIVYAEPPVPSALVPGLSPALDDICKKAMAKESTARYPSMKAFAAALMDFLRATPATEGAARLTPTVVEQVPGTEGTRKLVPTLVEQVPGSPTPLSPGDEAAISPITRTVLEPLPTDTVRRTRPDKAKSVRRKQSRSTARPSRRRWLIAGLAAGATAAIGVVVLVLVLWGGRGKTAVQESNASGDSRDASGDPFQVGSIWLDHDSKDGKMLTVTKRNGDQFTARVSMSFLFGKEWVSCEREVTGTIRDGSISWLAKDVRIIRANGTGGAGGDNFGTLGSDESGYKIDFVSPIAGADAITYTVRLSKGK